MSLFDYFLQQIKRPTIHNVQHSIYNIHADYFGLFLKMFCIFVCTNFYTRRNFKKMYTLIQTTCKKYGIQRADIDQDKITLGNTGADSHSTKFYRNPFSRFEEENIDTFIAVKTSNIIGLQLLGMLTNNPVSRLTSACDLPRGNTFRVLVGSERRFRPPEDSGRTPALATGKVHKPREKCAKLPALTG